MDELNNNVLPFETLDCAEYNTNSIVVVQENKCKYIGNNVDGNLIGKIHIDGGLILDGKRCDYLVLNSDKRKAYYIELKGHDYFYAIEQLETTISKTKKEMAGFSISARIVLIKVSAPDIRNNPKTLKFERELKKLGGNLVKKTRVISEPI